MKTRMIGSFVCVILLLANAYFPIATHGRAIFPAFEQEEFAQLHFLNIFSIYGATLKLDGMKLGSFWRKVKQTKQISAGPHVVTAVLETYSELGPYWFFTRSAAASIVFEAKPRDEYAIVDRIGRTEWAAHRERPREWEPQVRYWKKEEQGRYASWGAVGKDVVSRPLIEPKNSQASATDLHRAISAPIKAADQVLRDHTGAVYSVAIAPDGKTLASGSGDGTVKLWSLPDGKLLTTPLKNLGDVNALAITPDSKTLAVGYFRGGSYEVKLLSLPEGRLMKSLKGFHDGVTSLAVSPDGKILAAGSLDEAVRLFSLPEGSLLATMKEKDTAGVRALAVTPDGKTLVSGFADGAIRLWSLPDARLLATLREHKEGVRALAITPDGKFFASGLGDKTIKLWSLPEGRLLTTMEGHQLSVNSLAITTDGRTLISGSSDYSIKFWSLPDGHLLSTWAIPSRVDALAITADGKKLAGALWDDTVRLWSLP